MCPRLCTITVCVSVCVCVYYRMSARLNGDVKTHMVLELTFPQELPGTLQLLADAGCIERCAQVRNVHVHICPPSHQSLHTTVMTCGSNGA